MELRCPHRAELMQVLVTGASGFLGTHLVPGLAAAGIDGLAVSRAGTAHGLPHGWQGRERQAVLSSALAAPVDTVIHLEVKQHVFQPRAEHLQAFTTVNVDGTQAWLEWCAANRVERFVYFSSIKAVRCETRDQRLESRDLGAGTMDHGPGTRDQGSEVRGQKSEVRSQRSEGGIRTHIERGIDETAAGPNETPYGASKWEAEQCVRAWVAADRRRSALVLRPAVIYGPGNTANVAAMVQALRKGRFFLVGKNDNQKSLVAARNVAAALVHLLPRMESGTCEGYNITDAETLTVRELDALMRRCLGKSGNSLTLPEPLARLAAKVGDGLNSVGVGFPLTSNRLEALLETTEFSCAKLLATGFVHPETVEEGIRKMLKC